jgi:hypothetical protein
MELCSFLSNAFLLLGITLRKKSSAYTNLIEKSETTAGMGGVDEEKETLL